MPRISFKGVKFYEQSKKFWSSFEPPKMKRDKRVGFYIELPRSVIKLIRSSSKRDGLTQWAFVKRAVLIDEEYRRHVEMFEQGKK